MDIFSHSTQICGEYAFDSPQGQALAAGNQGLAQRDFASLDFSKSQLHGQISSIKNSDFHKPAERSFSQAERKKASAQRLKNQPQDTGIQCPRFDDPNLLA
jgi:hypothetical protein